MNFTADWFTNNIPNFEKCMNEVGIQNIQFLEIGAYEGRATCWLLQNGLSKDGTIVCIDPFPNLSDVEKRFTENTREATGSRQVVMLCKNTSYNALAQLIQQKQEFDFIYVDGDHNAYDALCDGCMAWGMLRKGGVMLFDDYEWNKYPEVERNPKIGVDSFLACYAGQYDLLFKNYQVAVRKK